MQIPSPRIPVAYVSEAVCIARSILEAGTDTSPSYETKTGHHIVIKVESRRQVPTPLLEVVHLSIYWS